MKKVKSVSNEMKEFSEKLKKAFPDEPVIESDSKQKHVLTPILKDYKVHSFIIGLDDLNYLFKFVDHMKYSGHIRFTQREALNLAIKYLKREYPEETLIIK